MTLAVSGGERPGNVVVPSGDSSNPEEATMSARPKRVDGKTASPYGYPFWDWVAKEDPEYVRARQPLSELSVGEGKELSIKHREMVIIGMTGASLSADPLAHRVKFLTTEP
jgi:hypothetical protein